MNVQLCTASGKGNVEEIRTALIGGAQLDYHHCFNQYTPLATACERGHTRAVEYLLLCGANANVTNAWAKSPLHVAAKDGHYACVDALLKHGADIDCVVGTYSTTPLMEASWNGHARTVKLLLERGANIYARSSLHLRPTARLLALEHRRQGVVDVIDEWEKELTEKKKAAEEKAKEEKKRKANGMSKKVSLLYGKIKSAFTK